MDGKMEGERDWVRHILPGSTHPIICTHREALWGSWLSLEVPLWVTAKQEISEELHRMASEDKQAEWNSSYHLPVSLSAHCVHLLSLYLSASSLTTLPQKRYQPATFKQISLFVCKRWIQVSQSCCCGGCTWCRITTKLIRNQEQRSNWRW